MAVLDIELPPENTGQVEMLALIDQALADFSHLSLVDAAKVNDVLLDLRGVVARG